MFVKLLPFISALLLALSFSRYGLGWISFVSLVPLFYFFSLIEKNKWSLKKILLHIWSAGLLFFLLNLIWLLDVRPDSWASIGGAAATAGVFFTWVLTATALSFGWLFFGFCVIKLKLYNFRVSDLWLIPAIWALSEYLRSLLASIVWWGQGATLGPYFNYGTLGFAAGSTELIFTSRLVGLFGVSFLVVAVNLAIYFILRRRFKLGFIALLSILFLVFLGHNLFPIKNTKSSLNVGIGQLDDKNRDYISMFSARSMAVMESATNPIDILFMPEETDLYRSFEDNEERDVLLEKLFDDQNGVIVGSLSSVVKNDKNYVEIQYKDKNGTLLNGQHKNFLIPIGEYLPKVLEVFLKMTAEQAEIKRYKELRSQYKGEIKEYPVSVKDVTISTLACSGILAPNLYREQVYNGAQILANISSLDIFSNSQVYFEQVQAMSRFQAVANVRPFIQSSRGGYSLVYSADGHLLTNTKRETIDFIDIELNGSLTKTPYSYWGEISLPLSIVILGLSFWRKKVQESCPQAQVL